MKRPIERLPAATSSATRAFALATSLLYACAAPAASWTASWQASPQPVWAEDFLFPSNVPAELHDQTVRQLARISLGGTRVRIVLANTYGRRPIRIGRATLAKPGSERAAVATGSLHDVTFGGRRTATIAPGATLLSDPVAMPVAALSQVLVSLYLPAATPMETFHWDGRQTGWIVAGEQTQSHALRLDAADSQSTTARLLLTGILVETETATRTLVTLGDSITDGASASLDRDSRWPDFLAERLAPHGVAVVNAGISGARLLSDGMGASALARLDRDVLAQPGASSMVVMLGINDIAWPGTAFARNAAPPTLEALIAGYRQLIERAHNRGIRVVGATLTPFEGALPGTPLSDYYQPTKEALRRQVNEWIRHAGAFDAVIDFDAALRDPEQPSRLAARYDSGDHLHPSDEGNRAMAAAVDLDVLLDEVPDGLPAEPRADSATK